MDMGWTGVDLTGILPMIEGWFSGFVGAGGNVLLLVVVVPAVGLYILGIVVRASDDVMETHTARSRGRSAGYAQANYDYGLTEGQARAEREFIEDGATSALSWDE